MRALLPLILLFACPAALAQEASPMLVIGGEPATAPASKPASEVAQENMLKNFPEWAVTRAATKTGGYDQDVPAAPAAPAAPTQPAAAPTAATPAAPEAPASPVSKLWPMDTVPIFMKSCVGYQPKLFIPCQCVIGNLMRTIPHDEFLKETANGTIEADPRLQKVRMDCATAPAQKAQ